MRAACLFSGGKDSTFTVWAAQQSGHSVELLITFTPDSRESYMFHHPNAEWTKLQAKSLGIPQLIFKTSGKKDEELDDLRKALQSAKASGIECIAAGALASEYQKTNIDNICNELGIASFSPLWHRNQLEAITEISQNFEVIITSVSAEGLGQEWLGRKLDASAIAELKQLHEKYGISIGGEGGEYETLVLNGPNFSRQIRIKDAKKSWEGTSGRFDLTSAELY